MCGIAGYIGKAPLPSENIFSTLNLMQRRGPDVQKDLSFENSGNNISLLHSRLSIIDLDERANQPMTIGDSTIILNGEIYNYIELRNSLLKKGVSFHTESDTEVLLHYYLIYGEQCVEHFEGMWAFAIFDRRRNKLFLSRDRFAEKPLYYYVTDTGFYFASQTQFLKKLSNSRFEVNENHLLRYLVNGHKSLYKTHETFYSRIQELPFASNLSVDEKLTISKNKYWNPSFSVKQISENEAIEKTREALIQSIRLRLRADVPMAFCLSGGVDSSGLISIASKIFNYDVATFSIIDEDERYNEADLIQATTDDLGCRNTKIRLSPKDDNIARLRNLVKYHDAPVATISYFVHSFLSEAISQNGFKIAVSGTSADEIFTGYYDHFNLHLYEMRNHPDYKKYLEDWKTHTSKFVRHPYFQKHDLYFENQNIRDHIYLNNSEFSSYLNKPFQETFTETNYNPSLLRNRMLNELFHEVVPVILHEDDLNSMYYSVENRSPYLDTKLIELAYSIPSEHLIKNGYAKYILREAFKGILNDKVRLAREKKGFNADIKSILDFKNPEHRSFLLDDSPIYRIVNKEKIENLIRQEFFSNSFKKFLFNFVNAKLFLENQQDEI